MVSGASRRPNVLKRAQRWHDMVGSLRDLTRSRILFRNPDDLTGGGSLFRSTRARVRKARARAGNTGHATFPQGARPNILNKAALEALPKEPAGYEARDLTLLEAFNTEADTKNMTLAAKFGNRVLCVTENKGRKATLALAKRVMIRRGLVSNEHDTYLDMICLYQIADQ